jgi:membrane protein implicated in regulation of membrane protease activity
MWATWWVWVVAGVLLGAVEVLLPGYVFLGFALGAIAVGLLAATGLLGQSLAMMVLVFAVLSLVGWAVLRAVFPGQRGEVKRWDRDINDN